MTFEVTTRSEISVRTNVTGSTFWLKATYNVDHGLEWGTNTRFATGGHYDISLDEHGDAQFYETGTSRFLSPDSIAQRMLESLLK